MAKLTRRQLLGATPFALSGATLLSACVGPAGMDDYDSVVKRSRRGSPLIGLEGVALRDELVRYATLAPSSHNTQCWKFRLDERDITILADHSRRCPAVDPDEHHIFVSLGCATENLVLAAAAHGLNAEVGFDLSHEAIRVALSPAKADVSPLFLAITQRQCTRSDYDSKPLTATELGVLERAGTSDKVRVLLVTQVPAVERVLDYVLQANTAQMADPQFVKEIKSWIRFNGPQAVRTRDGLYSATTGNPTVPTWLGELAFPWLFTPKSENDKYARQIRSSAGIAIFIGEAANKESWIDVGRCYERFALQATSMGIRNALVNQPVEVGALRSQFAAAVGLNDQRPDLVVRFGRGGPMPYSLRRPVRAVVI